MAVYVDIYTGKNCNKITAIWIQIHIIEIVCRIEPFRMEILYRCTGGVGVLVGRHILYPLKYFVKPFANKKTMKRFP
jgi:hypothetical protein